MLRCWTRVWNSPCRLSLHQFKEWEESGSDSACSVRVRGSEGLRPRHVRGWVSGDVCWDQSPKSLQHLEKHWLLLLLRCDWSPVQSDPLRQPDGTASQSAGCSHFGGGRRGWGGQRGEDMKKLKKQTVLGCFPLNLLMINYTRGPRTQLIFFYFILVGLKIPACNDSFRLSVSGN